LASNKKPVSQERNTGDQWFVSDPEIVLKAPDISRALMMVKRTVNGKMISIKVNTKSKKGRVCYKKKIPLLVVPQAGL
jgi:hypothetical protein